MPTREVAAAYIIFLLNFIDMALEEEACTENVQYTPNTMSLASKRQAQNNSLLSCMLNLALRH